jgi:hypothetical protein
VVKVEAKAAKPETKVRSILTLWFVRMMEGKTIALLEKLPLKVAKILMEGEVVAIIAVTITTINR